MAKRGGLGFVFESGGSGRAMLFRSRSDSDPVKYRVSWQLIGRDLCVQLWREGETTIELELRGPAQLWQMSLEVCQGSVELWGMGITLTIAREGEFTATCLRRLLDDVLYD